VAIYEWVLLLVCIDFYPGLSRGNNEDHLITTTTSSSPHQVNSLHPPGPTMDNPTAPFPRVGEVSSLALAPHGAHVAAGYTTGS